MSVVNDVLKNLDQRQINYQDPAAVQFYYEAHGNKNIWLTLGLIVSVLLLFVISAVAIYFYQQQTDKVDSASLVLSDDFFIVPEAELATTEQYVEAHEINETHLLKSSKALKSDSGQIIEAQTNTQSVNQIVKQTESSKASGLIIDAANNGNIEAEKSKISLASKKVQNEVHLRMLLKNDPGSVLTTIKRQHPDYLKEPILLALAAQGQQRSGNHDSAVQLYKHLIPLAPKDARWRAGLAISLETLGDNTSAARLYALALSMNNLPSSLKRFSESRLKGMQK